MKKIIPVVAILFFATMVNAQRGIEALVQAEKDFATYSIAHGTKDAFLKFADSAGIIWVTEVEAPANAIETWTKREKRPGKLDWQPQYAEISSSQDFGYTTGPYTFTLSDSIVANGEYVTAWGINKNGEWKFLVDLGVNNTPRVQGRRVENISTEKIQGNASVDEMVKAEQDFITYHNSDLKKAYQKYLSDKSILKRNRRSSATNKKSQQEIISDDPLDAAFKVLGAGIASSGDLGYIYGRITSGVKQYGYLRIWRKEKEGWKIALEVLRY